MDVLAVEVRRGVVEDNHRQYGEDFTEGKDRAPHYPWCMCYDRYERGDMLHPAYPFDTGPCYLSEDDPGTYPE